MKATQPFQLTLVLLVAFVAGTSSLRAWNYNEEGLTDDGGGTYNFLYEQNTFGYYVNKNKRAITPMT